MILTKLALAGALLAGHAASPAVTAVTFQGNVADTTAVSGPGTTDSQNGPVWAHDTIVWTVSATPDPAGNNKWDVTLVSNGEYNANANPITGAVWNGHGMFDGYIQYVVQVPPGDQPSAKDLPRTVSSATGLMDLVDQLFGQPAGSTAVGEINTGNDGTYNFVYFGVPGAPGGLYFQSGN